MASLKLPKLALAGVCALWAAGGAMAQESTNQVAAKTAWSVFEESQPRRECWAVSVPKETVNTKGGRVVAVNRSQILLMVYFVPDSNVGGQVGFTGGYPFAGGSSVTLEIDGNQFNLFTEGEWAWPASSSEDIKIVTALKRGTEAKLTAESSRGTKTEDTFSLLGFTAAFDDAEKRCK